VFRYAPRLHCLHSLIETNIDVYFSWDEVFSS